MNTRKKCLRQVFSFLEMFLGTALNAAAFGLIIVPQGFAAGGITGLSRVIARLVPLPLSAVVFVLNMILLLVGLFFVGREFAAKTVAVSFLFPAMLEVFSRYSLGDLLSDPMASALMAGAALGIGTGLVLNSGASCGGFDAVGVVLNKKFRIPVAYVMNTFDTTVIVLQAIGQPILKTVYGIIVIAIVTFFVSRVVTMGKGETQVLIFTEHHDAIRKVLLRDLDVGLTSLEAESGYARRAMKVIITVMPYQKVADMKRMIMEIDPTAFVVVDQINSVLGQGYTTDRIYKTQK